MKVLIGTPAYGGMVASGYAQSLHRTILGMYKDGVENNVYMMANESLIQRARNKIAAYALHHGYDRLIFIDADLRWTYEDFKKVVMSPREVVGGTYPVKALPIQLNYNPDNAPEELRARTRENMIEYARRFGEGDEAPMRHVPTGFLAISRSVLEMLAERTPRYRNNDQSKGQPEYVHNMFPVEVKDGHLMSEDWMFCELCREAGVPVWMNVSVVLEHIGSYSFAAPPAG